MPSPSFSIQHTIAVRINANAKNPMDENLVVSFIRWTMAAGIHTIMSGGHTSNDLHIGYYDPKDEIRIRKWLANNEVGEQ